MLSSEAMMAIWLPFKTLKFPGDPQFAYYGKEYPAQDLAYFEGVSPTIYEICREGIRWKYRRIRSR